MLGNDDANVFEGGGGNDRLMGQSGNDTLLGGDGDDQLEGGEGNDVLVGGRGADWLNGGAGVNTVDYSQDGGSNAVIVDLATLQAYDSWGNREMVENISNVIGSSLNDRISGSEGANVITGGAGNDTLAVTAATTSSSSPSATAAT